MHWNNWQKLQELYKEVYISPVVTIHQCLGSIHTTQTVQSKT